MSLRERPIRHIGGRTCLDFVNTANWSPDGVLIEERLGSDTDVAVWCRDAGLEDVAGQHDRLDGIVAFRNAVRRVIVAALDDSAPADSDVAPLNNALRSLPPRAMLPVAGKGIALGPSLTLDHAIAVSAMALLNCRSEIERVKICPGDDCAWLFLDESKNRRRTWCSMETCGNRAKAKRHYRRKTAASTD